MKIKVKITAAAIASWLGVLACISAPLSHAQNRESIKIGVILPLTGAGAGLGIPMRSGMVLAEKVINANGGVNGRALKLLFEDDATNPDTAISKANTLIYGEKVVAIVGPTQTASTVAVGGLTTPIKMPQVAFSGLGPAVERERKCVYHLGPSQAQNARAMLEYAKSIGAKRVGALYDSGYGTVVYTELRKLSDSYGIEFVATEKFEVAATDTTAQAAKIRAVQPDAIFVIGITGVPVRSIRQLQIKLPIISAVGQASYEIVKSMGDSADNVVFPEFLVGEDPLPNQKEFVQVFQKENGRIPKIMESLGWDSVYIVQAALMKVGPAAGHEKLCEAMRSVFTGVTTTFNFAADDLNGIKLSNFVYSKLVNGQFTRLAFKAKD